MARKPTTKRPAGIKKRFAPGKPGTLITRKQQKEMRHGLAGKPKSAAHRKAISEGLKRHHATKKPGAKRKVTRESARKETNAHAKRTNTKKVRGEPGHKSKTKKPAAKKVKAELKSRGKAAVKQATSRPKVGDVMRHPTLGKLTRIKTSAGRNIWINHYGREIDSADIKRGKIYMGRVKQPKRRK